MGALQKEFADLRCLVKAGKASRKQYDRYVLLGMICSSTLL